MVVELVAGIARLLAGAALRRRVTCSPTPPRWRSRLTAARLAERPAGGSMTYGLGRAEILSAQANGVTLLVLAA